MTIVYDSASGKVRGTASDFLQQSVTQRSEDGALIVFDKGSMQSRLLEGGSLAGEVLYKQVEVWGHRFRLKAYVAP